MVMPYAHLDRLAALPPDAAHELIDLAQRTEVALEKVYHPHGFNFGLNIGKAAGACCRYHIHLHAMPRWTGDTNFMTTVAETRVLPEELSSTWKRLRAAHHLEIFLKLGDLNHPTNAFLSYMIS